MRGYDLAYTVNGGRPGSRPRGDRASAVDWRAHWEQDGEGVASFERLRFNVTIRCRLAFCPRLPTFESRIGRANVELGL